MAAIKLHAGDFQKSAANSFNGRGFSLWSAKSTFAANIQGSIAGTGRSAIL